MIRSVQSKMTSVDELPIYPISRDERLDGNSFVKWHTARWLSSRTFKLMSWEDQGMARALFDLCQNESPIGTLPNDDDELAFMLRVDLRKLQDLRQKSFGPLRNWHPCLCGDEVRLMHTVVLEQVRDALDRREARALSKDEQAARKRMQRLREGLKALGLSDAAIADDVLLHRMDDWLASNWTRSRTAEAYRKAVLHAQSQRWFAVL